MGSVGGQSRRRVEVGERREEGGRRRKRRWRRRNRRKKRGRGKEERGRGKVRTKKRQRASGSAVWGRERKWQIRGEGRGWSRETRAGKRREENDGIITAPTDNLLNTVKIIGVICFLTSTGIFL